MKQSIRCGHCRKTFVTEDSVLAHIYARVCGWGKDDMESGYIVCPAYLCGDVFGSLTSLNVHLHSHVVEHEPVETPGVVFSFS